MLLFAVKSLELVAIKLLHLALEVGGRDALSEVYPDAGYLACSIVKSLLQAREGEVNGSIHLLTHWCILSDDLHFDALEGGCGC